MMALKIDTDAAISVLTKLNECVADLQGKMHSLANQVENISSEEWSGEAAQNFKHSVNEAIYGNNDAILNQITEDFEHMINVNKNVAKVEESLSSAIEKVVGIFTK